MTEKDENGKLCRIRRERGDCVEEKEEEQKGSQHGHRDMSTSPDRDPTMGYVHIDGQGPDHWGMST